MDFPFYPYAAGFLVVVGLLYWLRTIRVARKRFAAEYRTRFVPLTEDPSGGFVCCLNKDGTGRSIIRPPRVS